MRSAFCLRLLAAFVGSCVLGCDNPLAVLRSCDLTFSGPYAPDEYGWLAMLVGDTARVRGTLSETNGWPRATDPRFAGDPRVLRVDSTGLVTAVGPGSSSLVAQACIEPGSDVRDGGGQWGVHVVARPARVQVRPDPVVGIPGNHIRVVVTLFDAGGDSIEHLPIFDADIGLGSSDTTLAVVLGAADSGRFWVEVRALGAGHLHGSTRGRIAGLRDSAPVVGFVPALTEVYVGSRSACATTAEAAVYCWGEFGRVFGGDGSQAGDVQYGVLGVRHRFSDVAVGFDGTVFSPDCGLEDGGALYCWSFGLGTGREPVATHPTFRFDQVEVAASHTCARSGTTLWCWGANTFGQLGGPTTERCPFWEVTYPCSTTPVQVTGSAQFSLVRAGVSRTCGLTTDAVLYCWGDGYTEVPTPQHESFRWRDVTVASAALFGCGVAVDETVWCWGENLQGLGDGTSVRSTAPVPVAGGRRFQQVSAGQEACGLTTDGEVLCWGGTVPPFFALVPTAMATSLRFTKIGVGMNFGCGQAVGGGVYCWGVNAGGRFGLSTVDTAAVPVPVLGIFGSSAPADGRN